MKLTLDGIAARLGCLPPAAGGDVVAAGYAMDSRQVRPGDLFFALPGGQRDGHDFAAAALDAGAVAAVVSRAGDHPKSELVVADPLAALQRLAQAVRREWGGTVVAITGSAGKTTTKEMTAAVLATRRRVLKSEGNFNNHLGVPLTLLRLEPEHEIAVVEMGMNHSGEIARLAEIAQPDVGVFTNVGSAHLANFDSVEAIAAAKRELAQAIPVIGALVLNGEDARVARFGEGFGGRVVYYRAADAGGLRLQIGGAHNQSNAAAALATGALFEVEPAAARRALEAVAPAAGRGEVVRRGGLVMINDCYNANPQAMERMLEVLRAEPGTRHIAVLGEMRELGGAAPELHRALGAHAAASGLDALYSVGGEAVNIDAGARAAGFRGEAEFFPDAATCGRRLAERLRAGDVVLFKASRGVRLETALAGLLAALSAEPSA